MGLEIGVGGHPLEVTILPFTYRNFLHPGRTILFHVGRFR